ncbi:uncharacterized protein [Miscanthus floridulus]|uniref:uncharacterized protein n=1 Tax=Miscanthus floridulus TaxID=154761 RepID=UPI003459D2B0
MDGGSGLNILYANTLELLELDQSQLRGNTMPFHGIVPGKRTWPLGRIDPPVCFGTPPTTTRRSSPLRWLSLRECTTAILGWPCYAKFMAVPNYMYLKLKMSSPNGVITVESMYEHAYDCDVECIEYAEAIVEVETLIVNLD